MSSFLKRLVDVLGSITLLTLITPLWAFLVLVIKLDDGGPVLYRRRVMGLKGKQFDALKFRTMVTNADQVIRQNPELWAEYQTNIKLKNDPRITRVGRWLRRSSLDELPQLFNVLRGQMSLIGPRMIAPDELTRYGKFAAKRLSVRPGITGLWQVSGRQDVSYETRIRLDMQYIDNCSLLLDLKILLKTPLVVIRGRGAL